MRKSLPAQFLLVAFLIASALLLAAVFLEVNRDRAALLHQLEDQARQQAELLFQSIEQPMARGDDAGTAAEFVKIGEKFPKLHFSVASFTGSITYSTRPEEIRAEITAAHSGNLAQSYLDALDGKFSGPGGLAYGQSGGRTENGVFTRLIKKDGREQVLLLAPIENRPECYHCHGWSQPVLGAAALFADVQDELAAQGGQFLTLSLYALALALALAISLYCFLRRRFFQRLDQMAALAGRISGWEDPPASGPAESAPDEGNPPGEMRAVGDSLDEARHSLEKVSQMVGHLDFLESLLESLPLAVAVCDVQGRATYLSRGFVALLGVKPDNEEYAPDQDRRAVLLGRPLAELVYGRGHAQSVFAQMLRRKETALSLEENLPGPDGRELKLHLDAVLIQAGSLVPGAPLTRVRPEVIGQPEILGILCIFSNIEEITQTRAALAQRNAQLNALSQQAVRVMVDLNQSAGILSDLFGQVAASAAGQQESARAEAQSTYQLAEALSRLTGRWRQLAEGVQKARQSLQAGSEEFAGFGQAARDLVNFARKMQGESEGLSGESRVFIQKIQAVQELADQINLMALDTALEAARTGLGVGAAKSGADPAKSGAEPAPAPAPTGEVLTLFSKEPRRGRPRKIQPAAAGPEAMALLGRVVDQLRALAENSGQAVEDLKTGLFGLDARAKNGLEAAEAAVRQAEAAAELVQGGQEKDRQRLEDFDALLAQGGEFGQDLQQRQTEGEALSREAAKSGTLALQTLQAVQATQKAMQVMSALVLQLDAVLPLGEHPASSDSSDSADSKTGSGGRK